MIYGLWFVVNGVWFIVSGFWFLVSGFWFLVYGLRFMIYGEWSMVYGLWLMVCGLWFRGLGSGAVRTGARRRAGPLGIHSCVKSLRSSYMGLYPQRPSTLHPPDPSHLTPKEETRTPVKLCRNLYTLDPPKLISHNVSIKWLF